MKPFKLKPSEEMTDKDYYLMLTQDDTPLAAALRYLHDRRK